MVLLMLALDGVKRELQTENARLEKLIFQISEGESSALEELYYLTKTAVYGFALSILANAQDAEDILQETYIRIHRSSRSYQARGKPLAWMLTISRNLSLDRLKEKTPHELPLEMKRIEARDFSENVLDRLLLQRLLSELPKMERQIVMLHGVAGLKHREIAQMLGIPLATELSKYHRSLSKLRHLLEEEKDERKQSYDRT